MKDVGLAFTEKCVRCRQVGSNPFIHPDNSSKCRTVRQPRSSSAQDSENLRGNTASNYVLKRVANGYLILEASVEDLIDFSPFTHENGVTEMKTK